MSVEDNAKTQHPRTVLAARCLADEPNIAEQTAQEILKAFATVINIGDGSGYVRSLVDRTALEIGSSLWSEMLKRCLVEEYCRRSPEMRSSVGGVWGMSEVTRWERHAVELLPVFEDLVNKLNSRDRIEMLSAALVIMQAAFEEKAVLIPGLIDGLFALFELGGCESHAAAWALLWLNGGFIGVPQKSIWSPSEAEFNAIVNALNNSSKDHRGHRRYLTHILARVPNEKTVSTLVLQLPGDDFLHATAILEALVKLDDKRAVAPLLDKLDDGDSNFRRAVIHTLGQLGDKQAVSSLLTKLTDTDTDVRIDAAAALHVLGEPSHLARLIASDDAGIRRAGVRALGRYREWLPYSVEFDVTEPLRDPQLIISLSQMSIAARRFNLSSEQVSSRFEALAAELKLKLSWEP